MNAIFQTNDIQQLKWSGSVDRKGKWYSAKRFKECPKCHAALVLNKVASGETGTIEDDKLIHYSFFQYPLFILNLRFSHSGILCSRCPNLYPSNFSPVRTMADGIKQGAC